MSSKPASKKKSDEIKWMPIEKIRLPDDKPTDADNVHRIAESMAVHGMIYPLLVRRVVEKRAGKERNRTVLVSGRDRLEAAQHAHMTEVPVMFIAGDDVNAELVGIGDNLWRKRYTVLRRAEMLVAWFSLAAVPISGQLDQKRERGRPKGGLSDAARNLPVVGRSLDSRRKEIQRARQIASLAPEVKEAATKAGLDNNQKLLIKIAKSGSVKSQLRKVAELGAVVKEFRKGSLGSQGAAAELAKKSESLQEDTKGDEANSGPQKSNNLSRRQKETTLENLEKFWEPEGHRLWQYASFDVRQRFKEKLDRTKNKSPADVVAFVRDVFAGRKHVIKGELFEYGKTKGFSRSAIKKVCSELGYSVIAKRTSHPLSDVRYYVAPGRQ